MKSPRRPRLALTGILSFLILLAAVTPASSAHTNYATDKPTRAAAYLSSTPQSYISGGTVGSHAWGLGDLYIQTYVGHPGFNIFASVAGAAPGLVYLGHRGVSNYMSRCTWQLPGVNTGSETINLTCAYRH
jgi:hypothetical protein